MATVCCSDTFDRGRPDPILISEVMDRTGVYDPEKVIKIGSTKVNIKYEIWNMKYDLKIINMKYEIWFEIEN